LGGKLDNCTLHIQFFISTAQYDIQVTKTDSKD
jgi:hypothetical protein